jgi:serine/threonine-protein kinase
MTPITPEDWQRLESYFDELLDLDADERETWLEGFSEPRPGDTELLRGLLEAHAEDDGRLDDPLPEAATRLVAESLEDPLVGTTLGSFRIEEEIGRGGMGVVYRGIRTDGEFDQDVVVKVLRLGVDSEETRRRFLQERQILARLDHPAIVRILDGGFTADGRPYIVMNRIMGRRIDEYCDTEKLDVPARVRLFLSVIEAVDHAHRHLVIHRDLKPSNVWVDDNGKVHLLDFGIAKILDEDAAKGMTKTQHRLMTPEYASPEQFRQSDVTTASDIYQLGNLLYQILTGMLPYGPLGETPHEMEMQICEADPVPASRAVTRVTSGESTLGDPNEIFANRAATPAHLRKVLRGDLDLILMKALRKEPDRRYNTANGFRSDLIRWLSGDRIMARPDSLGYQARRFARRHPVAVALTGALLVCSVAFTLFHVNRVTVERDLAQLEAQRRQEVSDFLVNLLKVPDPTAVGGREVTARELLVDALPRIQADLTDVETKMRLLRVVADVDKNLGLLDEAGEARFQLVFLSTERYGRQSLETADELIELSFLSRFAREFDHALDASQEALAIRRELLPPGHLDIGFALKEVAMAHRELRETETAEVEMAEATLILSAELPVDDPNRVRMVADYAYILRAVGKADSSEALYREAIEQMREDPGEYAGSLPASLNNLAYLLKKKEQFAQAEALYREAIAAIETHYGDSHPQTLMYRNNLAATLQRQGKHQEARVQMEMAIPLTIQLHGEEHWRVGRTWRSLGMLLFIAAEYADSADAFRESVQVFGAGLGPEHLWTATAGALEATSLHMAGEEARADEVWRGAARILDTPDARVDGNVQGMLRLMRDEIPEGQDAWKARLESLISAEG